jgi:hypothetical protein
MNYLRLGLSVLGGILVALVIYGATQYYFKKPIPIVNNTTVQPGATLNVEQNKTIKSNGRLYTGVYGGRNNGTEIGIAVGCAWI